MCEFFKAMNNVHPSLWSDQFPGYMSSIPAILLPSASVASPLVSVVKKLPKAAVKETPIVVSEVKKSRNKSRKSARALNLQKKLSLLKQSLVYPLQPEHLHRIKTI